MSAYEAIRILHILGTVLIFGTGMGTAFFLLMAYRTGDVDAIRVTARHVEAARSDAGPSSVCAPPRK